MSEMSTCNTSQPSRNSTEAVAERRAAHSATEAGTLLRYKQTTKECIASLVAATDTLTRYNQHVFSSTAALSIHAMSRSETKDAVPFKAVVLVNGTNTDKVALLLQVRVVDLDTHLVTVYVALQQRAGRHHL